MEIVNWSSLICNIFVLMNIPNMPNMKPLRGHICNFGKSFMGLPEISKNVPGYMFNTVLLEIDRKKILIFLGQG
jgi:hypothetical protein